MQSDLSIDLWRYIVSYITASEIQSLKKCSKSCQEASHYSLCGRIAVASGNTAYIFDAERCDLVQRLQVCPRNKKCLCAKFSSDGNFLVTASQEKTAKVWNCHTGTLLYELKGHDGQIEKSVFSSDGKFILTASADNTARIWSMQNGEEEVCFDREDSIFSAFFTNDVKSVFTVHFRDVCLHSADTGLHQFSHKGQRILSAALSCDDQHLVTASIGGTVIIWNAMTGRPIRKIKMKSASIPCCTFSPTNKYLLIIASGDGTTSLWDIRRDSEIHILRHGVSVLDMAFCGLTSRTIMASSDQVVRVWDGQGHGQPAAILSELKFSQQIYACDFNHKALSIASSSKF